MSHLFHRIGLIYNPYAGGLKGHKRARLDEAVQILERAGSRVELFATPGPQKAAELACRAVQAGCDLILAAGGDGTINETVNGMAGSRVPFGVLPSGTANVLANEMGLATRPDRAAAQLSALVPARIALGSVEWAATPRRYFVSMAGVGLDAHIVYNLDLDLKSRLGKLAYWHGGFRQLGKAVPRFRIAVNGGDYEASFALITRVRNYGGDFEIARRVKLTHGDFEVVLFEKNEWHDYLRFLGGVLMNRLHGIRGVSIARSGGVEVSAPEESRIYIQVDGEAAGVLPATIRIMPDALTLLAPERYLAGD